MKPIFIIDLPKNEKNLKKIFSEDLHEISIFMRNLLIFFERYHEDFMKQITKKENKRRLSWNFLHQRLGKINFNESNEVY